MLVQQERLASVFNFLNGASKVEGLGEDDFEDLVAVSRRKDIFYRYGVEGWKKYLLHVDAVRCAAKDETGFHRLGEAAGLVVMEDFD